MAAERTAREPGEEEERGWDDGDISFHFPALWLLDDEGHYSFKEFPPPPAPPCMVVSFFLLLFVHYVFVMFLWYRTVQ